MKFYCVLNTAKIMHFVVFVVTVLFLFNIGLSSCSGNRYAQNLVKQKGIGKLKWAKLMELRGTQKNHGKNFEAEQTYSKGKLDSSISVPRQGGGGGGGGGGWGWGWPSHGGGGGGGYDVYTIIAVSAFAALFGALIYELLGGGLRRSYDVPTFNLPTISLGLDSEKLPEVMVKVGDWIANSAWFENVGNSSRTMRDLRDKIGIGKWFEAFKKDPVEYQCIRKMACETLASSPLAEKSLKSNFGESFLTAFGNYIQNGEELQNLVKQIVGNRQKCDEIVIGGYCEEN